MSPKNHHEKDPHWHNTGWWWWWGALPLQKLPMHKICFRVEAHIPTPYPTGKGIGLEKKMCKKASWYVGCGGWRGWPPLQQPGGQAEPHGSTRGGDRSCRYVEGRTSTKGVWSSLLGKARGKPGKAASQGGRRIFLDVILFLVLKLNDKSVSRKA